MEVAILHVPTVHTQHCVYYAIQPASNAQDLYKPTASIAQVPTFLTLLHINVYKHAFQEPLWIKSTSHADGVPTVWLGTFINAFHAVLPAIPVMEQVFWSVQVVAAVGNFM